MRINKDGSGPGVAIGPRAFRRLIDMRIHKYGYGMPGKLTTIICINVFFFVKS